MTQAAILAASGSPGTTTGFKNKIINGAMVIDQRFAGASVTPTATSYPWPYNIDRWDTVQTQASKFSVQQNAGAVTPPAGFTKYLGFTSLSAYSPISTDVFVLQQRIEGYNTADLGWGTANAKTVTLSFWVRSSLTGNFGGSINNESDNRWYAFSYTINAANTWEQKSITITGDTSGTWGTTNGIGLNLNFSLGMGSSSAGTANTWTGTTTITPTGSTNVVGTNGATFYITGVQLEVGTTATNFDFRSYGQELLLCQRYYQKTTTVGIGTQGALGVGFQLTATTSVIYVPLIVTPRTFPTVTGTNLITTNNVNWDLATTIAGISPTTGGCFLDVNTVSAGAQGTPVLLRATSNTTGTLAFSAEL